MKHTNVIALLAIAVALLPASRVWAQTDGAATFRVSTKTANGQYAPRNVMAIWVTDAQTNFVKTLKRQAASRIRYLYKWGAVSKSNVVDGVTGATLSSHQTHTVTWNCRNTNQQIVADGTYRFWVEFTEANAQGPWTSTNVISFYKGTSGVTSYPPNSANFTNMMIAYAPSIVATPVHDLAITTLTAPALALPGSTINVSVSVSNLGTSAESFGLALEDETEGLVIGSRQVAGLGSGGTTNVVFAWNTTGRAESYHQLKATAATVSGETNTANNVATRMIAIAAGMQTNIFLAPGSSVWRYNDRGVDLHNTAWKTPDYDDGFWSTGAGQFGYGDGDETTILSYGGDATNRHPCYYFRRSFPVDTIPTSLVLRLLRDDGVIVHLNGSEVLRDNMPVGLVGYNTLASSAVSGTNEIHYREFNLSSDLLFPGKNVLAVELHQSSPSSSDVSFDLGLTAVAPAFAANHDVAVTAVQPLGDATVGDIIDIDVHVMNAGDATESFTVTLVDTNAAKSIGSALVTDLLPGSSAVLKYRWNTAGATIGAHTLRAQASGVSGETNLVNNSASAVGTVSSSGFALAAVRAAGGIGGFSSAAAMADSNLILAEGAQLCIFGLANEEQPALLGSIRLPGSIKALAVNGTHVYTANGAAGLHIVDMADVYAPTHVNTFDSSGHASGLAVEGDRLYLADGTSGLRIFDIAAPSAPLLLGSIRTDGPARAVAASGASVFVLDEYAGLLSLDVTSPSAPIELGRATVAHAGCVALSGNIAWVGAGDGWLYAVDTSIPATPTVAGRLLLPAPARSVRIAGNRLYAACGEAGLAAIDIGAPSTPTLLGLSDTEGEACGVALSSVTAYVADGSSGLTVFDISGASPAQVHAARQVLRASDAVVTNGKAYVASGSSGVHIYDLASPSRPTLLGSFGAGGNARGLAVSGTTAFVADGQFGMKAYDVSVPTNIIPLGSYTGSALRFVRRVAVNGSRVIVTDGHTVELLDAANPNAIVRRDGYNVSGYAFDLAHAGNMVLVAGGSSGLLILDNTNPNALTFAGSYNTAGIAFGVAGSEGYAYVADGAEGWISLDIATPSAPSLVASGSTPAFDVALSDGLLQAGTGFGGFETFDVSEPATPLSLDSFNRVSRVLRITAIGGYAYVSEEEDGFAIFETAEVDNDGDGLSDLWEQSIVDADPNDEITSIADVLPNADFDNDGLSNASEFIAGTSPIDAGSVFAATTPSAAAGNFVIRWHSQPGKRYSINRTTDLKAGFTVLQSAIPATPPMNSYTVSVDNASASYVITVDM